MCKQSILKTTLNNLFLGTVYFVHEEKKMVWLFSTFPQEQKRHSVILVLHLNRSLFKTQLYLL